MNDHKYIQLKIDILFVEKALNSKGMNAFQN